MSSPLLDILRKSGGCGSTFDRIKDFDLGDGWFRDGPSGHVDFYSAWGFHYALTWINRIDPQWDSTFIQNTQQKFLANYRYLIGPHGFPILGRSVHYRIAASAPLSLELKATPRR
ncbi:DUF2264 domain-containing protein [Desulfonatronum thiosulfatophilum]|uniref:DUF2264 domain-containing protein n=1 Tax=Desulfonatronum thiosulfatophilum TaxID=617002 RepID=UPI003CC635B0